VPKAATVVVVTYNSAPMVEGLLDGLAAALDGLDADVVVVDNGSRDGTADLVERRGDCLVVRSTNRGYAAGINAGAAAAPDSSAILILNPDARLAPGAARALVEALTDRCGITAPRVLDEDGGTQRSLRREPTLPRATGLAWTGLPVFSEYVTDPAEYETAHDVDWALGAVLAVSRRCHDELGGWDESFFLYSEETDFCLRARDAGWSTRYVPQALASHIGGASGTSDEIHAMQILNRVRLYARRHGAATSALYWGFTVLSEATWVLRGHRQSRHAITALLHPGRRPPQLPHDRGLIPR
jgi:GT2 family glycosyltransferase